MEVYIYNLVAIICLLSTNHVMTYKVDVLSWGDHAGYGVARVSQLKAPDIHQSTNYESSFYFVIFKEETLLMNKVENHLSTRCSGN